MLSSTVGVVLRRARIAQGLSRAALAAKGGVSVRLVAELERGARPNVSLETALQLLHVVGVTLTPRAAADARRPGTPRSRAAETARRESAERSMARKATWVGSIRTRSAMHPPRPPAAIAARLSAVSQASKLVHALSRGLQSARQATGAGGGRAATTTRKNGKPAAPASSE